MICRLVNEGEMRIVVVVDLVKWRKRRKKNVSRKLGLKAF